MAIEINDTNFQDTTRNGVVLVDFWAPWCGPCRMLTPIIEELAKELEGQITVCKFNVDEGRKIPEQFGIMGVPSLLLFKDGELKAQKTGMMPKKMIQDWINTSLKD
ncbi:MAG: thioredoxin [Rickettsiales bacterium]|jgi:thioredoxin 1|nr:thioredoxin [Rickettsiales bacterium]